MTKEEARVILNCRGNGYSEDDFNKAIDVAFNFLQEPSLPAGLDEAAEKYANQDAVVYATRKKAFKAGAKWMAGQGQTEVLTVESPLLGPPMICCPVKEHKNGDKVIVQIRKNHD